MRTRTILPNKYDLTSYQTEVSVDLSDGYNVTATCLSLGGNGNCYSFGEGAVGGTSNYLRSSMMTDAVTPRGDRRSFHDCWHDSASYWTSCNYFDFESSSADHPNWWKGMRALGPTLTAISEYRGTGGGPNSGSEPLFPFAKSSNATVWMPAGLILDRTLMQLRNDRLYYPSSSLEKLVLNAWSTRVLELTPDRNKFSVWFLIVDLFQVKSLINSLNWSKLSKLRSVIRRNNWRYTLKELADLHLAVVFGLLPSLADIQDFVSTVIDIYNRWKSSDRKVSEQCLVRQSPIKFPELETHSDTEVYISNLPFGIRTRVKVDTSINISNSTARYTAQNRELRSVLDALKFAVDKLGVLDPSVIWDVIPFSFVLDWFFTIGKMIQGLKPRLLEVDLIMRDYCESGRIVQDVQVIPECSFGFGEGILQSPLIEESPRIYITGRQATFVRRRLAPKLTLTGKQLRANTTAISPRRQLVAASLVAQRVPRLMRFFVDVRKAADRRMREVYPNPAT